VSNQQDNQVDELFRQELEHARVVPSRDMWAGIEAALDEEPKRRVGIFWWGAAATVALLVVVGLQFVGTDSYEPFKGDGLADGVNNAVQKVESPITTPTELEQTASSSDLKNSSLAVSTAETERMEPSNSGDNNRAETAQNGDDKILEAISLADAEKNTTSVPEAEGVFTQKSTRAGRAQKESELAASTKTEDNSESLAKSSTETSTDKLVVTTKLDSAEKGTLAALPDLPSAPSAETIGRDSIEAIAMLSTLNLPSLPNRNRAPSDSVLQLLRQDYPELQEPGTPEDAEPAEQWALGGHYGPAFTSLQFGGGGSEASSTGQGVIGLDVADNARGAQSRAVSQDFAYSTGMQLGHNVSKRMVIYSGFNYYDIRGNFQDFALEGSQYSYTAPAPGTGTGTPTTSYQGLSELAASTSEEQNFKYRYFEFPVMVSYNLLNRRLRYFVSSGVSTHLFARYIQENEISGRSSVSSALPSQLNLLLGTGLEYRFVKRSSFSILPLYRYGLITTGEALTGGAFNSFGVNAGINFHF